MSGPTRTVVGIDPGTHLGWTALEFHYPHPKMNMPKITGHGKYWLKAGRYEGQGMVMLRFKEFLRELFALTKPDAVFQEEVHRHTATDAAHKYGAITHAVMEVCEDMDIPYGGVPVSTWKKYMTGKGNASKDAVLETFRKVVKPADPPQWSQDEIDSYGIALAGGAALWVR
jgi:crossover junction endodeoxyribonuclease RuvC